MKKLNNTTLIISILLFFSGNLAFTQTEENSNKEIELSFIVDSVALFPGDKLAMGKFLQQNLRYPIEAQIANKQGRIIVSFIVLASGKLTEIKTAKGVDLHLANEAKRIIKIMPDWVPAYLNGKPVNTSTNLPIKFNNLGVINR